MASCSRTPTIGMKCIKCGIHHKKLTTYKKIVDSQSFIDALKSYLSVNSQIGDFLCTKCYTTLKFIMFNEKRMNENVGEPESQPSSQSTISSSQTSGSDPTVQLLESGNIEEEYVELPIPRTVSTHKYCFICGETDNITQVPYSARKQFFLATNVFIPQGNRCCEKHMIKKKFYKDEMEQVPIKSRYSNIKVSDLTNLINNLRIDVDKNLTDKIADYSLSEDRLIVFTGLTWENIILLRDMLTSLRNSECRNVTQALVVFLFKLRSGNSNNTISAVLGLDRQQQVSDFCTSVIKAFETDILPSHFGFQAASREFLIGQTAPVAKQLHGIKDDQLSIVCDGTYLRHEKSQNNSYQRKAFSGQKYTHLCKPFTVSTTNGYIIDIFGPYEANKNDAKIILEILEKPYGLSQILRDGDVFFLDRGFRDAVQDLNEKKYVTRMPALKGQRKQLPTDEANNSRMVTMVRWVVEAVHGVMSQKFKLLHNQVDNKMLPNARSYCRIAGFLVNKFGKRYVSEISTSDEVIKQINKTKNTENTLREEVESKGWSRKKTCFELLKADDVLDFPELTIKELQIFFTGTYQMKQAISYLAELMGENNEIDLYFLKETKEIIKIRIRSRHKNSTTYNCYIHYEPNAIGVAAIKRCYCECANGSRTVGCCSHVASIVYYLSHARYLSKIVKPSDILTNIFDSDMIPIINYDSDDD